MWGESGIAGRHPEARTSVARARTVSSAAEVVAISWDSYHPGLLAALAAVPGDKRFVVHDADTGKATRAPTWGRAYAESRRIDQPTPESPYLAPLYEME